MPAATSAPSAVPAHYPFSAVVTSGRDDDPTDRMALALVLAAVSPAVGGVLVRGEKGTAKSTAVRALTGVLPPVEVVAGDRFSADPRDAGARSPDGPFGAGARVEARPVRLVELPVGATEDRLLGSLHLEKALSEGRAEYEPGLLARAHRGVLYVDEVNLLPDHLVDLLLDAAATGRVTVERDGVSVEHDARFVLVGTMNPEEGELRPQLLDRFGLTVEVAAPRDPALRVEVVRRRIAYDADPAGFRAAWSGAEAALTERVAGARARLGSVELSDAALHKVAEVCAAFDVDGLRADLVTARTAVAHAAWQGRTRVTRADIRVAALLALPHRRRRTPFDAPGLDEDLLDAVLGDEEPDPDPADLRDDHADPADLPDADPADLRDTHADPADLPDDGDRSPAGSTRDPADGGRSPAGSTQDADDEGRSPAGSAQDADDRGRSPAGSAVGAGAAYRPRLLTVAGTGAGTEGRRSRAATRSGRRTGSAPAGGGGHAGDLHLTGTVLAAVPHQRARGRAAGDGGRLRLAAADLRLSRRVGREANLVLLCVDASGSMAARRRMEQVKTAVLSLLLDAYQRRDRVGLVTFRGAGAETLLPPTRSVDVAARRLEELPAGGRTPLSEGLLEADRLLARERLRDPRCRPLLVVVTDGRATHGPDAVARSRAAADALRSAGVASVVVDCEAGPLRMGLAAVLAAHLGAEHVPVAEVSADALTGVVRDRLPVRAPRADRAPGTGAA